MIMVDDRTGSKELSPLIPPNIPHTLCRLPFADVAWLGQGPDSQLLPIGVERKAISDLCQSITTGRLSGHQLCGLLDEYWKVYILVEGVWRASPTTGLLEVFRYGKWQPLSIGSRQFMYREVANYLNTLTTVCRVGVWQTGSIEESARWLVDTYQWWQKEWDKHHAHLAFHAPDPPTKVSLMKPGIVHRVAKEFAGVGWDKGKSIATKYKTVMELAMASEEELREVGGIGKKLAKSIVGEIRGTNNK